MSSNAFLDCSLSDTSPNVGDHIFYTGNGKVGRIISAAAAKHLTPVTLELGGKSPVIIDSTADISISAKRVLWGKINNSGQICVAPDYILAERSIVDALVEALKAHYHSFYPEGALKSDSYGSIVSDYHFERLKGLLRRTKGKIVVGGKWDEEPGKRGFEPTIVVDVKPGDSLLEECAIFLVHMIRVDAYLSDLGNCLDPFCLLSLSTLLTMQLLT